MGKPLKMTRSESIEKISSTLKLIPEAEVYLYGSSARGDYRDDSDIDILILLPDTLSIQERIHYEGEIAGMLWPIELESGIEIFPVVMQQKNWKSHKTPFKVNVTNDRIPL